MSLQAVVDLEEQERADLYALLAALWLAPDAALLQALAADERIEAADDDALSQSWSALADAARRCGPSLRSEYDALFCAPGTPRINPYQCFYVAGWLMDKPLAQLRTDLDQLGLARMAGATELEDHLGALCEAMHVLITRQASASTQSRFFARHLAGWTNRCLADIAAVPEADFFRALAGFTAAFLALESETLAIDGPIASDLALPRNASRHATTAS